MSIYRLELVAEHFISILILKECSRGNLHLHTNSQPCRIVFFKHRRHSQTFRQLDHSYAVRDKRVWSYVWRRRPESLNREAVQNTAPAQRNVVSRLRAAPRTE